MIKQTLVLLCPSRMKILFSGVASFGSFSRLISAGRLAIPCRPNKKPVSNLLAMIPATSLCLGILLANTVGAVCPAIDPEVFDKALHSNEEKIVIDETPYSIGLRNFPGYNLESQSKPVITKEKESVAGEDSCKYTRRIGDETFGTLTLRPGQTQQDKKEGDLRSSDYPLIRPWLHSPFWEYDGSIATNKDDSSG